jgi:segregation and condensation protein A
MFTEKEKYKVKLELFEGPLDLLLYLIRKNEVDIYDIPIELITDQYLQHLELMKELNLDNVGEFILLASQLIYIKSQMLLPEDERGEEEEIEDPRLELVNQLLEYRKFKNAAANLDAMQKDESLRYPRFAQLVLDETEGSVPAKLDISIFDLLDAFCNILQSKGLDPSLAIEPETVTVADKIAELREKLEAEIRVSFQEFFRNNRTRMELICSFLAILELIRAGEITAVQSENFGDIMLQRNLA